MVKLNTKSAVAWWTVASLPKNAFLKLICYCELVAKLFKN